MNTLLEFKDIYRRFDSKERFLAASGKVGSGGILAIKGASGTGKSTLLRILARLVKPERGELFYQGKSSREISALEWRRKIHYVPQKAVMFEGTVEDNLRLPFSIKNITSPYDESLVGDYMSQLLLPAGLLPQKAHNLSGGEAARVALIRALLIKPEVLLLDEPTASLDNASRGRVISLAAGWVSEQTGRAIVLISHQDADLEALPNLTILDLEGGKKA
ncbi:ABC transporter ATP-binding protein [Syntrophomonas curvata]